MGSGHCMGCDKDCQRRAVFGYGQCSVNYGAAFHILYFVCFLCVLVSGEYSVKGFSGCPVYLPTGVVILGGVQPAVHWK